METKRLLIVDDHWSAINGHTKALMDCYQFLAPKYNYLFVCVTTAEEGVIKALEFDYDAIIMDYEFDGMMGDEAVKKIIAKKPRSKILAVSAYDNCDVIMAMKYAGVRGFIGKGGSSPEEFVIAIDSIIDGKEYYSKIVLEKIKSFNEPAVKRFPIPGTNEYITPQQREILFWQVKHFDSHDDLAVRLNISKKTVINHQTSLTHKFNATSHSDLLKKGDKYFKQEGIF